VIPLEEIFILKPLSIRKRKVKEDSDYLCNVLVHEAELVPTRQRVIVKRFEAPSETISKMVTFHVCTVWTL